LRDWLISRQRFWGTPIPIIYCDTCGAVPVPEKDLPVVLPENIKFESSKNPLIENKKFTEVKCPKCNGKARRETDTMDTFVNSSWYFFRYCDSKNNKEIFDTKKSDYWMPIDQYIGGAEHACMHLIYSRFYTKFFRDIKLTKINEPVLNLFNQGMVHGNDGAVMSKSRGNVVDPLDMIKKYSCDTLRIFLVSIASPDSDSMWSDTGIESMHKFIKKFVDYFENVKVGKSSAKVESKINKAIKEITEDIEKFRYNLAVIKLRGLLDIFISEEEIAKKDLENYLKLINPFCPHITEELWSKLKNKEFISLEKWPVSDEKKIDDKLEQLEQSVEKTINDIQNVLRIIKEKQGKEGEKIYLYVMPFELSGYNSENLSKRIQKPVKVFAVNDKNKYDPENKAGKAKPGKPGIFIE
ncbi:MAG: class I tRNA ligase family protein, partial [Candidatus Pacearchaeota archaeon]